MKKSRLQIYFLFQDSVCSFCAGGERVVVNNLDDALNTSYTTKRLGSSSLCNGDNKSARKQIGVLISGSGNLVSRTTIPTFVHTCCTR